MKKYKVKFPRIEQYAINLRGIFKNASSGKKAFSINDQLEIVEVTGTISSNGRWNYHNNYDSSELVLKCDGKEQWWTPCYSEAKQVQKENIDARLAKIKKEVINLASLLN